MISMTLARYVEMEKYRKRMDYAKSRCRRLYNFKQKNTKLALWYLSKYVKARDEHKCTSCRSTEELHCHHVKSKKDFPKLAYDPNNCITLCRKCHMKRGHGWKYNKKIKKPTKPCRLYS